jgi:molecular chaperone GrpE
MSTLHDEELDHLQNHFAEEAAAEAEEIAATEEADEADEDMEAEEPVQTADKALTDMKDKHLRLMAEFDNYRRRTAREQLELRKTAGRDILLEFLPVVDDFDRAEKSGELVSDGLRLLHQKMQTVLRKQGVEAMETNGEPFDVNIHEALTEIPAPTEELKGKIIDTIERGYTLNGSVIRIAKVIVGA